MPIGIPFGTVKALDHRQADKGGIAETRHQDEAAGGGRRKNAEIWRDPKKNSAAMMNSSHGMARHRREVDCSLMP